MNSGKAQDGEEGERESVPSKPRSKEKYNKMAVGRLRYLFRWNWIRCQFVMANFCFCSRIEPTHNGKSSAFMGSLAFFCCCCCCCGCSPWIQYSIITINIISGGQAVSVWFIDCEISSDISFTFYLLHCIFIVINMERPAHSPSIWWPMNILYD